MTSLRSFKRSDAQENTCGLGRFSCANIRPAPIKKPLPNWLEFDVIPVKNHKISWFAEFVGLTVWATSGLPYSPG
jgi:hypothetical protein